MAHLVNGNIETFIVHAGLIDARTQMSFPGAHLRAHGMARATSRIHGDVIRHILRAVGRKPEPGPQVGNVFLISLGGRISLLDHLVELGLGVLAARPETAVPDVEGLKWAAEPRL